MSGEGKTQRCWVRLRGELSRLKATIPLVWAALVDTFAYARDSFVSPASADARNLIANLAAHAHVLEKGINHAEMRPGFGADRIAQVVALLRLYRERGYDWNHWGVRQAMNALFAYVDAHDPDTAAIRDLRGTLLELGSCGALTGGSQTVPREELLHASQASYETFAKARHSIRHYAEAPVDLDTVRSAVALARTAPSACNRQSWHVYAAASDAARKAIVQFHEGCRGFGEKAPLFLVVTVDRKLYMGARERNLCYVDGGIFAMSLLHSLHYYRLGACTLNWASMPRRDRALKRALGIDRSEAIVVLISVGQLPEELKLPLSTRKPVEDCLSIL